MKRSTEIQYLCLGQLPADRSRAQNLHLALHSESKARTLWLHNQVSHVKAAQITADLKLKENSVTAKIHQTWRKSVLLLFKSHHILYLPILLQFPINLFNHTEELRGSNREPQPLLCKSCCQNPGRTPWSTGSLYTAHCVTAKPLLLLCMLTHDLKL